jgi:hypothetical protein
VKGSIDRINDAEKSSKVGANISHHLCGLQREEAPNIEGAYLQFMICHIILWISPP